MSVRLLSLPREVALSPKCRLPQSPLWSTRSEVQNCPAFSGGRCDHHDATGRSRWAASSSAPTESVSLLEPSATFLVDTVVPAGHEAITLGLSQDMVRPFGQVAAFCSSAGFGVQQKKLLAALKHNQQFCKVARLLKITDRRGITAIESSAPRRSPKSTFCLK